MALEFQTIPFRSMDEVVFVTLCTAMTLIPFFFLCDGVRWGPRHEREKVGGVK